MPAKQDARERLTEEEQEVVAKNTGLIGLAIKKVGPNGNLVDDQFQDGAIALMTAARKYDESKGWKFSTYATKSIYNALLRNDYQYGPIHIPRDLKCKGKSTPERMAAAKKARSSVSLNVVLRTPEHPSYSDGDDDEFSYEATQAARRAVLKLEPIERDMIQSVVMGGETMMDFGKRHGFGRWTTRGIKRRALAKLRARLQKHV